MASKYGEWSSERGAIVGGFGCRVERGVLGVARLPRPVIKFLVEYPSSFVLPFAALRVTSLRAAA